MRLWVRIVLFVLLTCVVPLLGLAFAAESVARERLERVIIDFQVETVQSLATLIEQDLAQAQETLTLQLSNFRLATGTPETRFAFLVVTCRLLPDIAQLQLVVPGEPGMAVRRIGEEVRAVGVDDPDGLAALTRLGAVLPPAGQAGEVRAGRAYTDGSGTAVVPLTVASRFEDGVGLGVAYALSGVRQRMKAVSLQGREVALLDPDGHLLMGTGTSGLIDPERYRPLLDSQAADLRYKTAQGEEVLAALAQVRSHRWSIVVAEPAEAIGRVREELRLRTWFIGGFSVLCAAVLGLLLTGTMTDPIVRLRNAAVEIGKGNLGFKVAVSGGSELDELGASFNWMSEELANKTREIEAFNRELQDRVDQRTAQLREAQARLLQSGQLAAVAELASGVAHELNNPLAGILGLVQILSARRTDATDAALLKSAEEQALRCKDIISSLQRFTNPPGAGRVTEMDLQVVLKEVMDLVAGNFKSRGIEIDGPGAQPLRVHADPALLGRAFSQMLTALKNVVRPNSRLLVRGAVNGGRVLLDFSVPQTTSERDDWQAAGLSFWVARQIFEEQGATLTEREEGEGRVWTLTVPVIKAPDAA